MANCINFMAYSKLSEECQKCEFKDKCEQKQNELIGGFTFTEPAAQPLTQPLMQPLVYDERQQRADNFRRNIGKELMKGGQE